MKHIKFGLVASAMIVAAGAGFSGGAQAASSCTAKIGAVLPTSVDWGRPIAETAKFAVDVFNKAGGVKGCTVKMILRDSQVDPKVGVDAAKSLVDLEQVPVIIGAVSSGVSMPILTSVAVPANVMQMSCCSASTEFTGLAMAGKTKGLWYRTYATTRMQAAAGAMLVKDKGYKKIVIFYKNDDWGQDLSKLIRSDLEKIGIKVTAAIAINDAQPSYRAQVTEALKSKPDALYLAIYPTEGISLVREWLSLGGTQNMVMANGLKSDDFRKGVGNKYLTKAIGHDAAQPRTQSAKAFNAAYKAKFGKEPNGPGLPNIYDAVMISLLAMEAAGKDAKGGQIAAMVARVTDPKGTKVSSGVEGLKMAIKLLGEGKSISYQGATGGVDFDKNGDVSAPAVTWSFTDSGTREEKYISLDEIVAFISSLK